MEFKKSELKSTDSSVPIYPRLVHELYQGRLPVVVPLGNETLFWAIFEPPKTSRLWTDGQFDRETHITRIVAQVGDAAWHMSS